MPLTGSVVQQMMARFIKITFIAYKKVKIKFTKAKCVLNRCNDLFKQKKNILGSGTHLGSKGQTMGGF